MKKIAVIHDLSGLGKCSLTAVIKVVNAAITAVAVILFTVSAVLMFSFAVNSDII